MSSKAVYARLQIDLYEKVKAHAGTTDQSISSAVEDLIQRGLGQLSSEGLSEALEKEAAELKSKVQELEKELAKLQGSLEACRAKESIAMAAQTHANALQQETENQRHHIEQLRSCLLTQVATCRRCHAQLLLIDVGQRRCTYCGACEMELLPDYRPSATTWEIVRNGAAVVGAGAIVIALLNALGGNSQRD